MVRKVRVRCPVCSMLPEIERVRSAEARIQVIFQELGGRLPKDSGFDDKGRPLSKHGIMSYEDVTETETALVEEVKGLFRDRIKAALILLEK